MNNGQTVSCSRSAVDQWWCCGKTCKVWGCLTKTTFSFCWFSYLFMWVGMASKGGWFILQIASHTKPFSPSISQQSAVTIGNRSTDSRTSQHRKELAVDKIPDEEPPAVLRFSLPVLWAIWDLAAISIGESQPKIFIYSVYIGACCLSHWKWNKNLF